jgi:CcmD family protein
MRPIYRVPLLLAALLLAATPAATRAQSAPAAAATAPTVSASPSQTPADGALPADREPPPPRTLRAYWHVWIAFSVAWLLLFGYVLSLGRRFGRLEAEVRRL